MPAAKPTSYQKLLKFVELRKEEGITAFTLREIVDHLGTSEASAKKAASALQAKGFIHRLTSGFYLIRQGQARAKVFPAPIQFIGKLMEFIGQPYYIGLTSATLYHGASTDPIYNWHVFTTKSRDPLKYGKYKIAFVVNKYTADIPKNILRTLNGLNPTIRIASEIIQRKRSAKMGTLQRA